MPLEFDADDQELELFLAETNDHLLSLDQDIVRLESTPDDPRLLQSIFRSAHTIKGGAGMIGHQRMTRLAHVMENVLDGLRARTLVVTPATIDALLAALDGLRVLNNEVVTRAESAVSLDPVVVALEACLAGSGPAAVAAPPPPAQASDEAQSDLSAWKRQGDLEALLGEEDHGKLFDVALTIDPDCGLSAARTLQAYLELARGARIIRTIPALEQIEADETTNTLRALIATDELPTLLELRLSQSADVMEARVLAVTLPTVTAAADAARAAAAAPRTPAAAETMKAALEKPVQQETSIRISVSILDNLMSLVSELVLSRTRLQTLRTRLQDRYRDDDYVAALEDAVGHLDHVSNDLQASVMKARMLPVENVFNKFPRLMRDLASQVGKKVSFTMSGQETELDRSVIEQLSDPLIHLLRNAIDHGMESPADRVAAGKSEVGSISLAATPGENHIMIEVRDDGRGIDPARMRAAAVAKGVLAAEAAERLSDREAVELVFAPGFSTASTITNISGRGVGMDIVKSAIERMGGHIQIDSAVGAGTTFAITLPLTLAIMQALLVSVDDGVYALPLNVVTEILSISPSQVQVLQGTEATLLRGTILPIIRLRQFFGCPESAAGGIMHVVATRVDGQLLGLAVDSFIGEQEIVMKPLGRYMGTIQGLSGATILGDGRIGLLIDVASLKHWSPAQAMAAA